MKHYDGHMKEPKSAHAGRSMGGGKKQPLVHSHSARVKRSPSVKMGSKR